MTGRVPVKQGLVVVLATACAFAACGGRPHRGTVDPRYQGPILSDDAARGRNRYEIVCSPCHGDHSERVGPLLAGLGWSAPEVRAQVREGTALMPPIRPSRLSDDDLEALLAYFVELGVVADPELAAEMSDEEAHRGRVDAGVDAPIDAGLDAGELDAGELDAGELDAGDADLDAGDALGGDLDAGVPVDLDAGDAGDAAPHDARAVMDPWTP